MKLNPAQLGKHLQGALAPVYVVSGDEPLLCQEACDAIRQAARQQGFSERQVPVVPAEVYGHVFTAQERANLQDGKTILVSDLKSANNKTFSSYLKVNANSGQLQYFQENPDIRRNTARRAAQADDTQNRQQEQKKGSRQAV